MRDFEFIDTKVHLKKKLANLMTTQICNYLSTLRVLPNYPTSKNY